MPLLFHFLSVRFTGCGAFWATSRPLQETTGPQKLHNCRFHMILPLEEAHQAVKVPCTWDPSIPYVDVYWHHCCSGAAHSYFHPDFHDR